MLSVDSSLLFCYLPTKTKTNKNKIPVDWKSAMITPTFEAGDPSEPIISLLVFFQLQMAQKVKAYCKSLSTPSNAVWFQCTSYN